MTAGHEFIGEVLQQREGEARRQGFALGDDANSGAIIPSRACLCRRKGPYRMCNVHDIFGFPKRANGARAEDMRIPDGALNRKAQKQIPLRSTVFFELLACSVHAVERGDIRFRDSVVIAGRKAWAWSRPRMKGPSQQVELNREDDRRRTAGRIVS